MDRTHQVTLQVSPHLFLDAAGRHITVVDRMPLSTLRERGLRPLLVYAITCQATKLRAGRLALLESPAGLADTLARIWREDVWMKGIPDRVVLSPELAKASSITDWLKANGIEVDARGGKSYAANRRAIGMDYFACLPYDRRRNGATLDELNAAWSKRLDPKLHAYEFDGPVGREIKRQWEATPYRPIDTPQTTAELDWIYGSWAEIGFRHAIAPQDIGEQVRVNREDRVVTSEQVESDYWGDTPFELRDLLGAWPEPYANLANQIEAPESRLRQFVGGRFNALDYDQVQALKRVLGLVAGEDGYLEVMEPILLHAKRPRAADRAFSFATCGGDVELAVEVVHQWDSSAMPWHVVVFRKYSGDTCYLLIDRTTGGPLPARWRKALINLAEEPLKLSPRNAENLTHMLKNALNDPGGRASLLEQINTRFESLFDQAAIN